MVAVPTHKHIYKLYSSLVSLLSFPLNVGTDSLARAHKVQIRAPNSGVGDPPGVLRRAQYVDSGHVSAIRGEGLVFKEGKEGTEKSDLRHTQLG